MFEQAIDAINALEDIALLGADNPIGEFVRYQHDDGRVAQCLPFKYGEYLYVAFFIWHEHAGEGVLENLAENFGVQPGQETFAIKFARADVRGLSSTGLFNPEETRRLGGALRVRDIPGFIDRLVDVVETHLGVFHVDGYLFLPAHHSLSRLYRMALSSARAQGAGLVRVYEVDCEHGTLGYFLLTPEYAQANGYS